MPDKFDVQIKRCGADPIEVTINTPANAACLKKTELNREQEAAVFCDENAVVAAGAGAGKTTVLAKRFAWLITGKRLRINEILCLTFTDKAAVEMYQRIYKELFQISIEDGGDKGKLAKEAINNFIHARIQTLDSYCNMLVRQCASRYGINPNFTIDENRCHSLADEASLEFAISNCKNPVIKRFYSEKNPVDIADRVFSPILKKYSYIESGPDIIKNIQEQFDIICAEWKKTCGAINAKLDEVGRYLTEDAALLPAMAAWMKENKIIFPAETQIREYFNQILEQKDEQCVDFAEADPLQDSIAKALKLMRDFSFINLTGGRRNDNPVKAIIKDFFRPIFGEFSSLSVFCGQAGLIYASAKLIQVLQEQYLYKKRSEGILTFNDVSGLARTILLEQRDIRQGEKEIIKAIMIDEFQDNNELQKDLLFLLAEKTKVFNEGIPPAKDLTPDKLYFVGDEKQSIYLFRSADVSVFRKLKNELQCKELPLSVNYRSAPELISAFNAIFGGSVFDSAGKMPLAEYPSVFIPAQTPENSASQDAIPPYEAIYMPLEKSKTHSGGINICVFDSGKDKTNEEAENLSQEDALSSTENEACFTAERIKQLLEQKTENNENKYKPEDIAILFRTRTAQYLFEKHLRRLNIPYTCENLSSFFFGGPINDLMSVLRLAAFPADKAAYAEMLRSPFAGLSLAGLAVCLAQWDETGRHEPFTDDPLPHLTTADQYKYRQGQTVYKHICEKARHENTSALVSELWYSMGYRYETEWNPETAVHRELYDYLFHLAVQSDAKNTGLAAFTEAIQSKRDNDESISDIDIPLERPGAVRLMTIHKSKGLEFPVVFLCCCGKYTRRDQGGDVFDAGPAGIAISPPVPEKISGISGVRKNYFREKANSENKRKRTAELRRLLYVGMTRAKNELFISGCVPLRNKEQKNGDEPENDISLLLKNWAENQKKPTGIPGDSIIDNETFFGLLLPALVSHIPQDRAGAKPSFLTIEEIPACSIENIYSNKEYRTRQGGEFIPNNKKGLEIFIKKTEPYYSTAREITIPVIADNHFTPTSLEKNPFDGGSIQKTPKTAGEITDYSIDTNFSGEDAADVFAAVDAMLNRFAGAGDSEKFSAADFGAIAHACAEALFKNEEPIIPPKLNGFLTPKESETFLNAGKELAARFIRSPLGKTASSAQIRKNEFPFRTLLIDSNNNETFINGTIDLLFEDEQTVYVVDFKTDSQENPGAHAAQMACYYHAANELLAKPENKNCRVWLYYLRSGHAAEMRTFA